MSHGDHSKHKDVRALSHASDPADMLDRNIEWIFLDNSDKEGLNKEGDNVDVPETATIQKSGNFSTWSLHNSFDTLHEECELPSGETQLAYKDPNHNSNDTLSESATIIDKVSKEIVCLIHFAHS